MKIWAGMTGAGGKVKRRELVVLRRDVDHSHIKDFGLTLEEGKSVLPRVQAGLTEFQAGQCGIGDWEYNGCGGAASSMIIGYDQFTCCLASAKLACPGFDPETVRRRGSATSSRPWREFASWSLN